MGVATARSVSLQGAAGHIVDVQVDVSQGVIATTLVGRVDSSVGEGRDRCRMAVGNSGFAWPTTRRTTILLSPTDLPKRGPHFDLAIATAVLAASDQLPPGVLDGTLFLGELTLDGRLRPVPGVLPMVMIARAEGIERVVVPESQAREASLVPGVEVFGMRSLAQVAALLAGSEVPDAPPVPPLSTGSALSWRGQSRLEEVDMADLVGMEDVWYAVEVAAAGGHHLMLSGPKGTGKTSIAERIPSILPDLTVEESLELTALHSLAGNSGDALVTRPPFFAPHHSSTRASLIGGGSGRVRPGELSRAHCGVLFLDEFPLFHADIIESLRQPLESGEVTIARGEESATYPARGLVVCAANPCPCGNFHPEASVDGCTCSEVRRREYRRRLTGPILDRIDITRHLRPLPSFRRNDPLASVQTSAEIRERVAAARVRQRARFAGAPWRLNSQIPGQRLREGLGLTGGAQEQLDEQVWGGRLTHRGATRVHRLAWTVADLSGVPQPGPAELEVALRLRTGAPLDWATVAAVGR